MFNVQWREPKPQTSNINSQTSNLKPQLSNLILATHSHVSPERELKLKHLQFISVVLKIVLYDIISQQITVRNKFI